MRVALLFLSIAVSSHILAAPPANDARHQAAAALHAQKYDEAIRLLDPLLRQSPNDASLWTLRGIALDGQNHVQQSLASYDHALTIDANYLPALEAASQTAYHRHNPQAMRYLKKLLELMPENRVANAMAGTVAYRGHDCPASVEYFERSQSEVLRDRNAIEEYSDCLLQQQQAQNAVDLLRRGSETYPDNRDLKYNLAIAELRNHQPEDAIRVLEPLATTKDADLLNLLAEAYTQAKRPDDAFRVLEQAIALKPNVPSNYLDLAVLCLEHNQENRSVAAATAGIARIPKATSLYLIRGVAYAQLAQYENAEKDFVFAAQIDPDQPHSTIAMSLLYSDRNQVDKEKALLTQQLKKTPKDAVANYLLANLLLHEGARPDQPQFQEAEEHLRLSLASRPDSAEAQILMGKVMDDQGKLAEAAEHYQAALKLEPENRNALNREFILLRKLHRDDEATQVLAQLKAVLNDELKREDASTRLKGLTETGADHPADTP
ncbi:tetratricopeptide repeat protein [Silvibacterium acidisoli]|uniref:tetratricopeptide repeat protein n=1 Tax=Acidobacteriaceae bacterium ZG23-2 TaxID=2883246 RepID=UPI00406C203C